MPINPDRISADIDAIASFSESAPGIGHSRPTFSPSWAKARDYVVARARSVGCQSRIDSAGNVHIRPGSIGWDRKVWLSGSHLDSVPTGGKFDGVVGVIVPLELLRAHPDLPLELILFAEEEGTTFGIGMIGSRAWTGELTAETLASFKNTAGQTFAQAGRPFGVEPDRWGSDRPSNYIGLIEVHIEQGPALWANNQPIAIVDAIAGRRQYRATFTGVPNHAGSTGMNHRSDALAAAADVILHVEAVARHLSPQTVATVGRITCEPNAVNVIPGKVTFTIDFRSPVDALLTRGDAEIRRFMGRTVKARNVADELVQTENQPAVAMDPDLVEQLKKAAPGAPVVASGALHDAAIMAPHIPTAMIFVASKDGISHNPAEFSRIEDIAAAASLLERVVSSPR
jgi:hydantoinase/carbamoylase family amidase